MTRLKTESLDPNKPNKYCKIIARLWNSIEDITEQQEILANELKTTQLRHDSETSDLTCKQNKQEERINILEGEKENWIEIIAESTCAILKEHTLSKVYLRTTAVDATISTLKRCKIAIVTGKHGVGKSTIAYQVLLELSKEIDFEKEGDPSNKTERNPLIINSPDQWQKAVNPKKCLIVYLEDFLGSTNIDNGAVESWKRHLDSIYATAKNGDVFVLIGLRENILIGAREKLFNHKLFQEEFEIKISTYLSRDEKKKMFEAYEDNYIRSDKQGNESSVDAVKKMTMSRFTDREKEKIIDTDPFYGFPLACYQFFSRPEFFECKCDFFSHPDKNLFNAIDDKHKSESLTEKMSYAVLAYASINQNINPNKMIDELFENICLEIDIARIKIKRSKILDAVMSVKGSFLEENENGEYIFTHETVFETILVSFGNIAPEIVISTCSRRKLRELVRTLGNKSKDGEVVLQILEDNYEDLAKRLLCYEQDDEKMNPWNLAEKILWHPATEDPVFVSVLLNLVERDNQGDILRNIWCAIAGSNSSVILEKMLELYRPHFISCISKESEGNQDECHLPVPTKGFQERVNLNALSKTLQQTTGPQQSQSFVISREALKIFLLQCINNFAGREKTLSCVSYIQQHKSLTSLLSDEFHYSPRGMTLLHCCILLGWEDVVDKILETHEPTTSQNEWTCAHFASYIGNFSLLKKFFGLYKGAEARTEEKYSLLQTAFIGIRYGPGETNWPLYSVTEHKSFQMTLCFPSKDQYKEVFEYLFNLELAPPKSDLVMIVDDFNNNIINYLILQDYAEILQILCRENEEIALHRNESKLPTALHWSVFLGRPRITQDLWTDGVRPGDYDLPLEETLALGERFKNKTIEFSRLYGKDRNKWCWNDGKTEIPDIPMKLMPSIDVVFGSDDDFIMIRSFLQSQSVLSSK